MPKQGGPTIVQTEGLSMFHMLSDNGLMSQPSSPMQLRTTQSPGPCQWQLNLLHALLHPHLLLTLSPLTNTHSMKDIHIIPI